jgi:hypothetical protein
MSRFASTMRRNRAEALVCKKPPATPFEIAAIALSSASRFA